MTAAKDLRPRVLFTAPWEPILVRRGDALGLRALADRLGDSVAPELTNRINDGRWLTILAWCLCRSHAVFHKTGGRNVGNRLVARERYTWLRPLELMWVARTMLLVDEDAYGRPLAGQRRVRRWLDDEQVAPRFAMTPEQYRSYRQTGMYGRYRLAFRKWPRLSRNGDGWTPGVACAGLAKWLDSKLGAARTGFGDDDVPTSKWSTWRGNEAGLWLKNWPGFEAHNKNADDNTLPPRRDDESKLPEAHLLEPIVFGSDIGGKRRRLVATLLSKSHAVAHQEAVEDLARAMPDNQVVQLLPSFACLADAGTELMDAIAGRLRQKDAIAITSLAKRSDIQSLCKALVEASVAWTTRKRGATVPHLSTADNFAEAFVGKNTLQCLTALLDHHEQHGGGMRWFVLRNGQIVARANPTGISSRYRFRLWPLCRLATQCGVIASMPDAVRSEVDDDDEDET